MKEMFLWEVEYALEGAIYTTRAVRVITEKDSYGEAERIALSYIDETLETSNFRFLHILNIKPSITVYKEREK